MTTATEPLTARQAEILGWWRAYQDQNGVPPSWREIGRAFGIKSPNGVACHVKALVRKGYVRINGRGLSRSAVALPIGDDGCCPTFGAKRAPQTRMHHWPGSPMS